jgi:transposase-like protein
MGGDWSSDRPWHDHGVFAGFRFSPGVISVAVRWYLRYGFSYGDAGELLAERGVSLDHVTVCRWVAAFHPGVNRGCTAVPARPR